MTAIKSKAHIKQLAQQRLPVPSAEVERLVEENERLREALGWYGENARLARLVSREGDKGRHAIAHDGGNRARAALSNTQKS